MHTGDGEHLVDHGRVVLGQAAGADPAERVKGRGVVLATADDVRRVQHGGRQRELLAEAVGRGHQRVEQDPQAHVLGRAGLPAAPPGRGQGGFELGDPLSQPPGLGFGVPGCGDRLVAGLLRHLDGIVRRVLDPAEPVGGGAQPAAGVLHLGAGNRQPLPQLVVLDLGALPECVQLFTQTCDRLGGVGRAGRRRGFGHLLGRGLDHPFPAGQPQDVGYGRDLLGRRRLGRPLVGLQRRHKLGQGQPQPLGDPAAKDRVVGHGGRQRGRPEPGPPGRDEAADGHERGRHILFREIGEGVGRERHNLCPDAGGKRLAHPDASARSRGAPSGLPPTGRSPPGLPPVAMALVAMVPSGTPHRRCRKPAVSPATAPRPPHRPGLPRPAGAPGVVWARARSRCHNLPVTAQRSGSARVPHRMRVDGSGRSRDTARLRGTLGTTTTTPQRIGPARSLRIAWVLGRFVQVTAPRSGQGRPRSGQGRPAGSYRARAALMRSAASSSAAGSGL